MHGLLEPLALRGCRGGNGRGRARGRARLRIFRRGSGGIRIKAELLFADRDHVGSCEQPLPFHPSVIYRRPVRAGIDEQIALGRLHDLSVATRDVLAGDNDVAGGVAAKNQRRTGDRVFPAVRQRHDAPTGVHRDLPAFGLGFRPLHRLRHVHRLHVLCTAAATLIDERELLPSDLDFVAMEEGRRFGTQAHAVDQDVRFRNCLCDDDLTVWQRFQLRVFGENTWDGERDGAAGIRAE